MVDALTLSICLYMLRNALLKYNANANACFSNDLSYHVIKRTLN